MCLSVTEQVYDSQGYVTDTPIICWKVMKKVKPFWLKRLFSKNKYFSPYQNSEYVMDEVVNVSNVVAIPQFDINMFGILVIEGYNVSYGLHSIVKYSDAQTIRDTLIEKQYGNMVIVECIIPAGSQVFKGTWNNGFGTFKSFASNTIIMKEDVTYEFDWTNFFKYGEL